MISQSMIDFFALRRRLRRFNFNHASGSRSHRLFSSVHVSGVGFVNSAKTAPLILRPMRADSMSHDICHNVGKIGFGIFSDDLFKRPLN
jgi:hypothetical protein